MSKHIVEVTIRVATDVIDPIEPDNLLFLLEEHRCISDYIDEIDEDCACWRGRAEYIGPYKDEKQLWESEIK